MNKLIVEGMDHDIRKITIELTKKEIMNLVERKTVVAQSLDLVILIKQEGS